MRLTTTVPEYLALAAIRDDAEREIAWVEKYEAAQPAVFEVYYRAWGLTARRAAAAHDVLRLAPTMAAVEARARGLVAGAERYFRSQGLIDDDLDVVLMVGAHTSNGWVTEYAGRETLFLALEFLGEEPFDAILVSHEAFHVAHDRHGAGRWPEDCAGALFQEGFAVAVSRDLHPGLGDGGYLWFDDTHGGWADDCAALVGRIARRALEGLDTSYDDPRVRALFTVQESERELPPRAGYWLGDLLLRGLLAEHPMGELLAWDHTTARAALAARLTSLVETPSQG
ncbi:hypothetical protein [Nocardioides cynanchi]|uniref:hypothetical protein n=1 Tax=Nocardioides cynanchi TaxID=2558918 RepID=UPI001244A484|nr:hypothetical protein [Nocardioides cynanchi]